MKVPNSQEKPHRGQISLSRLQNEGSQRARADWVSDRKSIKATE